MDPQVLASAPGLGSLSYVAVSFVMVPFHYLSVLRILCILVCACRQKHARDHGSPGRASGAKFVSAFLPTEPSHGPHSFIFEPFFYFLRKGFSVLQPGLELIEVLLFLSPEY